MDKDVDWDDQEDDNISDKYNIPKEWCREETFQKTKKKKPKDEWN